MHHLAYLAAFDHQSRLHAFLHIDEMMMYGADGQQRGDGGMAGIHVTVGKDDVVHALVDRLLGATAKVGQGFLQTGLAFAGRKERG